MAADTPQAACFQQIMHILGPSSWKTGADAARYSEDPRGSFRGHPCPVALPISTEQTAQIVALCNRHRVGVIPYGGGTGVVAGQLSLGTDAHLILSLERMNRIRHVSAQDFVITVEAGCVLEHIHAEAEHHGLIFPLSMGSKGSCTIGGNLATNAGGIQVLRHGNARDLCLGIEAVLANGDVLDTLTPLRKNNTGYDLRHLLIGSEGTLGVITAATLIVKPIDAETVTGFCALRSPKDAVEVFQALRSAIGDRLSGLELMSTFGMDLVTTHFTALRAPFSTPHPWYLLMEAGGNDGLRAEVETALAELLETGRIQDAVLAESQTQRAALWALRENTPEANRNGGAFCSSDTSVPIGHIDAFIAQSSAALFAIHPGLRINTYGHIGDGNIHHNVLPPAGHTKPDFLAAHPDIATEVRETINRVTLDFGGSISAEHGIGRLKRDDLGRHASAAKLRALRAIKAALDPNGIMNPGAMLAAPVRGM